MTGEQFKQMILPISEKLYRIALQMLLDDDEAKDILQDFYYKLWERKEQLKDVMNTESYCVKMIKNMCINKLKVNKRYEKVDIMEQERLLPIIETPEDQVISREVVHKVYHEIDQLPAIQKQILHLKQFRNCSDEEIAEVTGLSEGNIRVILSRARKTLKEKLQ